MGFKVCVFSRLISWERACLSFSFDFFHRIFFLTKKRFAQVELSCMMEANSLAQAVRFHGLHHEILAFSDPRIFAPIKLDMRVVIVWDTDMTDVGLEVLYVILFGCFSATFSRNF